MMRQYIAIKKQGGVVLFIALIALVVMSIAAAALIRSVDTNTTIVGNLSFQQSALISASRGAESAMTWLSANDGALDSSVSGSAYYATSGNLGANLNLDDRAVLRDGDTWDDHSRLATGDGIVAGVESDTNNTINYIIERMCSVEGEPPGNPDDNSQNCLLGKPDSGGGGKEVRGADMAGAQVEGAPSVIYRVTVRVTGPKNTQSYSQVFVY